MRTKLTRPVAGLLSLAFVALAGTSAIHAQLARSGPHSPDDEPPPLSVTVDPSVATPGPELPGFEESTTRPVASVAAGDGTVASLVENELWLMTRDDGSLADVLSRWGGTVLATVEPGDLGTPGGYTHHLVRVDASSADPAGLTADLRALGHVGGEVRVSSEPALHLLAAAAQEAARGLPVGLNWVGQAADLRDGISQEAATATGSGYDPNAFNWDTHSAGNSQHNQDIGVAEAWRILDLAGKLDNKVTVAVLDGGFRPDSDTPAGWKAISNIPFRDATSANLSWCTDFNRCPWHGTNVVSAGFAVPDNQEGAAGPGGPVAELIMINTLPDFFSSIQALALARLHGAKIVNMSYGIPVYTGLSALLPGESAWALLPFNEATRALSKSGMLLFASAGNEGKNVDAAWGKGKFRVEKAWWAPCENNGVICVGGLARNSTSRATDSNYGGRQVDIFAPYPIWVGPDPDDSTTHRVNGTSFSSPFVAGVAALIWAADPDLSAGQVRDILLDTAHTSPDGEVGSYVNALGAVREAIPNVPPAPRIVQPGTGAQIQAGDSPVLIARADDYEDGADCCTFSWWRRAGGATAWTAVGTQRRQQHTFTTPGTVEIAVRATDSGGAVGETRMTVEVVNTAPAARIVKPTGGEQVFVGQTVQFYGTAEDPNEPTLAVPCDRLVWTSDVDSDPLPQRGCHVLTSFDTAGPRVLTLRATDSHGDEAQAQVRIEVVQRPDDPPPSVRIILPLDGQVIRDPDLGIERRTSATDPLGEGLDYRWTVTYPYDPDTGAGETSSLAPFGPWRPADTFDYCALKGQPVKLALTVVDADGRTGSDFVILTTEHCVD